MIELNKLDIVPYPHPALRWICNPITKFTPLLSEIAEKMFEIMYSHRGMGLAANQIGLPFRMFVCDAPNADGTKKKIFVNPNITISRNPRPTKDVEGCLSMPGVLAEITRPSRDVRIEAQDLNGKPFVATYVAQTARVVQHEVDHLNGKLFTDHLEMSSQLADWLNYLKIQYQYSNFPPDEEIVEKLKGLETYVS